MTSLTPGERTVRWLTGGEVDRPPFWYNLGWFPWGMTLEQWKKETGNPKLDIFTELGFEPGFDHPRVQLGIFPAFEHVVLREETDTVVYRDARGITMRNRRDGNSMPEFLEYPVKTPGDWEQLKAERLRIGDPSRITEDLSAFRDRVRAAGHAVQVGGFPFGAFGTPRDLLGVEALLIGFYEYPDMIRDMIQHLTGVWLAVMEQVAAVVPIDHIHIWEDMSGRQGSLISPAMVESFMMPAYDRIRAFARAHNVRIISVDTDGDCSELVPIMMRHGVNLFLPFEVQAGNDIRAYRKQYPELAIVGGLDKRALAGSRASLDAELHKAEWMLAHGRYAPGFDHLIPPDVPWEAYRYAAERVRTMCMNFKPKQGAPSCH